ncbi:MAG: efflux RND transporter periplasmic adaptor subunit [Fibrobacteria bacterium]|nr:efflux RND transporter periplasmic adaptor subunit [Fibrobacteria bacterium]
MQRRLLPSRLSGIVWLAAVAVTAVVTWKLLSARTEFRGIAEDGKQVVSFAAAVEVIGIDVQPGQSVEVGDTLARVRNPELTQRITEILHTIEDASGDATMNSAESRRRIAQIRAETRIRQASYLGEIRVLEEQRQRNQKLVSGFKALGVVSPDTNGIAIDDRIQSLRHQIEVEDAGMRAQVALLEGTKGDLSRLAASRKDALQAELAMLREEESRLVVVSATSGVVDSIHFQVGEKVSPFAPILAISGHRPTFVRGYIQESLHLDLAAGDSVEVVSSGARTRKVPGRVVGLGSRIVELPPRLWKVPDYPVWGREVVVKIPADNQLLLGAMVSVRRTHRNTEAAR